MLSCSWEVYAGSHDLSLGSEEHRVVVKTTESIIHPDWNPSTLSNDIALIKLPKKIEFADGKHFLALLAVAIITWHICKDSQEELANFITKDQRLQGGL